MALPLRGLRVLVLGLARTGESAAKFCAARGARVVAVDEAPGDGSADALGPGIECRRGEPFPDPADFDLVVPSPGVPPERYRARATRVAGDIELAADALRVPIAAITGTNGKSTVTRLATAMLCAAGLRARAAGNVGEPALDLVGLPIDWAVLEVSSFQLETTETFRPRVAAITNITPDHLDRHATFEAYVAAKARILARQEPDDVAVLNVDDAAVRSLRSHARGRVVPVSASAPQPGGVWLDAHTLRVAGGDAHPDLAFALDGLRLTGRHNRENAAMALAVAVAAGADPTRACAAIADFAGLPHRSEVVADVAGVRFVNDSKATNPGAAAASLRGQESRVVWIAGGRDKGLDFAPLAAVARERVRAAVLCGEAAEKLRGALGDAVPTEIAESLEAAVERAAALAQPGDIVLLAPACASQDRYRDFAARGDAFRAAVADLGAAR